MEIVATQLCEQPAPPPLEKKTRKSARKTVQDEVDHVNHQPLQQSKDVQQLEFSKTVSPRIPLLFSLRPSDGLRFQIGDIVKAHNFLAPLLINELWQEGNTVYAKLFQLNRENNSTVDNFFLFSAKCIFFQFGMGKGSRQRVQQRWHLVLQASSLMPLWRTTILPISDCFFRKICIGRALWDSISSGFSNLNSCRVSSGPYNIFCDGLIWGFGTGKLKEIFLA